MAGTGTLASLAIALGIDDRQVVTGLASTRAKVVSQMQGMSRDVTAQSNAMATSVSQSANKSASVLQAPVIKWAVAAATIVGGLGAMAIQFESEAAHIASSMGLFGEEGQKQARGIATSFLDMAGNVQKGGQGAIYTAKDMQESFADVAGQLALVNNGALSVAQSDAFMIASMNLAAGTNSKLADSTSAVSSVLQNFQLGIDKSSAASNVLYDASRGLHMSLGETADTMEKLRGRTGGVQLSLSDTAALMEIMATHALTGQRNINLFAGAIDNMLSKSADPTKVVKAQDTVAKATTNLQFAQQKYDLALSHSGVSVQQHTIDLQKLQDAESRYQAVLTKYGPNTVQTQSALVSVETAQQRVNSETARGSTALVNAQDALTKAKNTLATAQTNLNSVQGANISVLKDLGVRVWDTQGKFVGMRSIIQQLHDAFQKLTPEQQMFRATQLFGSPAAATAMIGIIHDGVAAWDKYTGNVSRSNSAQQGAAAATENLAAKWHRFVAEISAGATRMALIVEPFFGSLLSGASTAVPIIITLFSTLVNIAGNVIGTFGNVANFITFGHAGQVIVVILGLLIARLIIAKGIDLVGSVVRWTGAIVTWTTHLGEGSRALDLFVGKHIQFSAMNMQGMWSFAGVRNYGQQIAGATNELETLTQKLSILQTRAKISPDINMKQSISKAESELAAGQGKLRTTLENAFTKSNIPKILSAQLEEGTKAAGIQAGLINDVENAGKAWENALKVAAQNAEPAMAASMSKVVAGGAKTAGGGIVADAEKTAGILGGMFGKTGRAVAKGAQIGMVAGSQMVYVVNWPSGFGSGGGLNLPKLGGAKVAATVEQDAVRIAEQGTARGLAADATSNMGLGAKIVGGIRTVFGSGAGGVMDKILTSGAGAIAGRVLSIAGPIGAAVSVGMLTKSVIDAINTTPTVATGGSVGAPPTYGPTRTPLGREPVVTTAPSNFQGYYGPGYPGSGGNPVQTTWQAPKTGVSPQGFVAPQWAVDVMQQSIPEGLQLINKGILATEPHLEDFLGAMSGLPGGTLEINAAQKGIADLIKQGKITTFAQLQVVYQNWDRIARIAGDIPTTEQALIPLILASKPPIERAAAYHRTAADTAQLRSDHEAAAARQEDGIFNLDFGAQQTEHSDHLQAISEAKDHFGNMRSHYTAIDRSTRIDRELSGNLADSLTSNVPTMSQNIQNAQKALSGMGINIQDGTKKSADLWNAVLTGLGEYGSNVGDAVSAALIMASEAQTMAQDLSIVRQNVINAFENKPLPKGLENRTGEGVGFYQAIGAQTGAKIANGPQFMMVGENNVTEWIIPQTKVGQYGPLLDMMLSGAPLPFSYPSPGLGSSFTSMGGSAVPSYAGEATVRGLSRIVPTSSPTVKGGPHVEQLIVQNPLPEPASESVDKRLRRLSYTGLT